MSWQKRRESDIDWDGVFTLSLALMVCALTGGAAYGFWLGRVIRCAQTAIAGPSPGDCLVVPGKRLVGDCPDRDFGLRLQRAAALSAPPFTGHVVILGGRTAGASVSEAEAGRDHLLALRPEARPRILLEAESQNTLTNLRNLRDLLTQADGAHPTMTLISSRYHLARLALIATSLGLRHRLAAAEDRLNLDLTTLVHLAREALFCLWFVVGKGWARVIGSRRMLARVT